MFDQLKKQKKLAFIVGGSGLIGSEVINLLLRNKKMKVVNLDIVQKKEWFKSCYKIDKKGNYSHCDFNFTGEEYYNIPECCKDRMSIYRNMNDELKEEKNLLNMSV